MDCDLNTTLTFSFTAKDVIPLLTLLCFHLNVRSVTVIWNQCDEDFKLKFQKYFSDYFIVLNFFESENNFSTHNRDNVLLFYPSESKLLDILVAEPRKIFIFVEDSKFLQNILIPAKTEFYFIIKSNKKWGCYRKFRPISEYRDKICETATWENESWITNFDKNKCLKRILYEMKGVTFKLGSIRTKENSPHEAPGRATMKSWNTLQYYLGFEFDHVIRRIVESTTVTISYLYPLLISQKVDGIAVTAFVTKSRASAMDFAMTGLDYKYNFVVKKPECEPVSWEELMITIFPTEVWICMSVKCYLTVFIIWMTTRKLKLNFQTCFFFMWGLMCSQNQQKIPKNMSTRIACFVAMVDTFLTIQCFTSSYYSMLSTRRISMPFKNLDEFMSKKSHSLMVYSGTSLHSDMQNGSNPVLKNLWENFLKNDPDHAVGWKTTEIALKKVCSGKSTILAPPVSYYFPNPPCELVKVEPGYFGSGTALPVRKGFPFLKQFQITLLRALEYGLMHRIQDESQNINVAISKNVVLEPVSFQQISYLIILFGGVVVVSFVLLLLELIHFKIMEKSKGEKKLQ